MLNATTVRKDEWGNVTRKSDADGNEWRYTYDGDKHLLSATDPLGTITKNEYDPAGNQTRETIAAGTSDESVTTWTYNQYKERLTENRGGAVTTYTYDNAGNLTEIKDPAGNKTSITYDTAGNLLTRTLPLVGNTVYDNYDYKGNPGAITDPNGNSIIYTYDLLGRVKSATNQADGGVTQYSYVSATGGSCPSCSGGNGNGKIASIILPEGNRINYEYDNIGNLAKITDNDGNSINYTYDSRGNKVKEEIKDAVGILQKTVSNQYDLINRLQKVTNPDNSATEFGYDRRGNRTALKNPNGNTTTYAYDVTNRLTKVTQPGNVTTTYSYDRRNNLTSVTDANGNTTTYEYDKQNRLTKTTSPDTGITTYTYDPNGNLKTKTDAKGIVATYTYDAANRLTAISFPDSVDNVTYAYDSCLNGKGRLCSMTDPSGATTYEYTLKGQIRKETKVIDGTTYTTEYGYDKNGNITGMKYPSGRIITYSYANDKVSQILNNGAAIASTISYKPFGGLATLTYGNGIQQTTNYDQQYRIGVITAQGVQNLGYAYDKNSNITAIADALDPTKSKTYGYDALDRLTSAIGPWGNLVYTYDKVGNRQKETNGGESIYSYQTNKLITTSGAKQYAFGYDANGNTVSENTKAYIYNQNQRLIKVTEQVISKDEQGQDVTTTTTKGEYVYNGNGQRSKKVVNGQATLFFFDQQGKLIAETGETTADYLYLNGNPFAKGEGASVYFYHNDHLGTPQRMTDNTKQIVWAGEFKPFGEAINITGTVTNSLRFPGQYAEQETMLHYNYFRDYKPDTGRYEEADPIGLQGGMNLYSYTDNNSLIRSDIYGLLPGGGPNAEIRKPPPPEIRKPRPPSPPKPPGTCLKCNQPDFDLCLLDLDPGGMMACGGCLLSIGFLQPEGVMLCVECLANIGINIPDCVTQHCKQKPKDKCGNCS